jgi:bacteriophage N4 adsorption protein B
MTETLGFIFVSILLLFGFDDLIWDFFYLLKIKRKTNKYHTIEFNDIAQVPPRLMAVIIAAYREEDVIFQVVENLILSNIYPRSMYYIFIGVYPNDPATQAVVDQLSLKYPMVHKVVHVLNGPSSKADNLNNIIQYIVDFEQQHQLSFKGLVLHDSEDLVHPYELVLENYLFNDHAAIQIPVFPLQQYPRFGNIFKNMITGTYADEFAENHFAMLVARNAYKSFVPSAGTGFALRRDVWDLFDNHEVFPVGSMTEDFKLSLDLKRQGIDVFYPLVYLNRTTDQLKKQREFIATRSLFPQTYSAAVRQKSRWIYGITMQSFRMRDIIKDKQLTLISKYTLYKDWKAKFANLMLGPGYAVFIYFIMSLFLPIPVIFPEGSISWYIIVVLSIAMIERQSLRFLAIANVYGYRSAAVSVLFPVLLPFRLILGNLINFHATINAWRRYFFDIQPKNRNKSQWSKTDHEFLPKEVLNRFFRTLGDILVFRKVITANQLKESLRLVNTQRMRLGSAILKLKYANEQDVASALAHLQGKIYLNIESWMIDRTLIKQFQLLTCYQYRFLPLVKLRDIYVLAITVETDLGKLRPFLHDLKIDNYVFVYTVHDSLVRYLIDKAQLKESIYQHELVDFHIKGVLSIEQFMIALSFINRYPNTTSLLVEWGLIREGSS